MSQPVKRAIDSDNFLILTSAKKLAQKRLIQSSGVKPEPELNHYLDSRYLDKDSLTTPSILDYWSSQAAIALGLSALACDILAISIAGIDIKCLFNMVRDMISY